LDPATRRDVVTVIYVIPLDQPAPDLPAPDLPAPRLPAPGEASLLSALREGDEHAYTLLMRALSPTMLQVARLHVPSTAVAEEAVQDTWLVVLQALPRFEQRSSLRSWIFGILINVARAHGRRERRSVPVGSWYEDARPYAGPGATRAAGDPEHAALHGEARRRLRQALTALPVRQRRVVELHDLAGLAPAEVCAMLDLSAGNHRVLLHRGRARLRRELEDDLDLVS